MKLLLSSLALLLLTGCGQQPFNLEDNRVTPVYCDSMAAEYDNNLRFTDSILCVKNDVGIFFLTCDDVDQFREDCLTYACTRDEGTILFSTDCKTK